LPCSCCSVAMLPGTGARRGRRRPAGAGSRRSAGPRPCRRPVAGAGKVGACSSASAGQPVGDRRVVARGVGEGLLRQREAGLRRTARRRPSVRRGCRRVVLRVGHDADAALLRCRGSWPPRAPWSGRRCRCSRWHRPACSRAWPRSRGRGRGSPPPGRWADAVLLHGRRCSAGRGGRGCRHAPWGAGS
jgi:hypothetical protein